MCKNQMVRDQGTHQNFSIVGMILVLVIGSILILLSLVIDMVVEWVQQHLFPNEEYKRVAWFNDAFLQLQKHAHVWDSSVFDRELSPREVFGSAREKEDIQPSNAESTEPDRRNTDPFMVRYELTDRQRWKSGLSARL